jgi:hypothetical protein
MPIYTGIQVRNYRVGQIKAGDKDEKGRPRRLDGFRFVTPAQSAAAEIANYFQGDEVRPFGRQWEVYTKVRNIAVALPPGKLVISQAMMRWSGGGPTMVCDGINTSQPSRGPCQCPQPADPDDPDSVWDAINERRRLAGQKTPQGCYPYTWINVCLPDIGGLGVWQMLSKSENAAAEIIQQAALLERARAAGQYLPAEIALEYRESRVGGMLRQYNVPALRIDASIRAIANGGFAGRSLADQLPPAPGEQRQAITAGPRSAVAVQDSPPLTAQQIADAAAKATTTAQIKDMKAAAEEHRVESDMICPPGAELYEELDSYLHARWEDLSAEAGAA